MHLAKDIILMSETRTAYKAITNVALFMAKQFLNLYQVNIQLNTRDDGPEICPTLYQPQGYPLLTLC